MKGWFTIGGSLCGGDIGTVTYTMKMDRSFFQVEAITCGNILSKERGKEEEEEKKNSVVKQKICV